ncbi:MAG: GIY-YIG nuclease family protein [Minisyncoccia bacterium]
MIDIEKIPNKIGVYIFKDKDGRVLYVGKAVNLKERIKQHLKSKNLKIIDLIKRAKDLEYLILDSEAEALIKEAELIKKFDPEYNYLLKDDSQYFYVCFTNEEYPKVFVTHQPERYDCEYIGPFTEGSAIRTILKIIREDIPFCTCLKKHSKSCINSLLGLCYGWCCKKGETGDKKLYNENIKKIKKILSCDLKKYKKELLEKLESALKKNDLKTGMKLKKEISAINKITSNINLIKEGVDMKDIKILKDLKDLLSLKKIPHIIEAYDVAHFSGVYKVGVMVRFKDGRYEKNGLRRFRIKTVLKPDDPKMIYEILNRRLKHKEWGIPDLILVDGGIQQYNQALLAIKDNGLEKYLKIISIAKPKGLLYYNKNKRPIELEKIPKNLKNFIKLLDKRAHLEVLKYHRKIREKIR